MANTYTLIASSTVGAGGATSVEFTSIPSTYTDLLVKISSRDTQTTAYWSNIFFTFNNSASGYSERILANTDGSVVSANKTSQAQLSYVYGTDTSSTSSTFGNSEIYIPNYTSSNNKSVSMDSVSENNGTQIILGLAAGLWANSAAITSIKFTPNTKFAQYATFYLYGIKNQ